MKKQTNFLKKWKDNFFSTFSNDIGIDLGTANALVHIKGIGIVIDEPSVVAFNNKTGRVIAVGHTAKEMLGRTPDHITAERPIIDGVISNFEVAGEMITYLINKAEREQPKRTSFFGPRVIVGVPSGITNVEVRAVQDATLDAGARKVYIVEEPMAAAIGEKLSVNSPQGTIIMDIGGGTTDIAIISLGGIVNSKKLTIAGDKFNDDIIDYIKNKFKILIGQTTAEDLKINVGSVINKKDRKGTAKGRDLITGLAKEIEVTSTDIRDALKPSIETLVDALKEVLETASPEVLSDSLESGMFLTGGGALLNGLPLLLSKEIKMPVHIVEDPLIAVVSGTGIILENIELYQENILNNEDEVPFSY